MAMTCIYSAECTGCMRCQPEEDEAYSDYINLIYGETDKEKE